MERTDNGSHKLLRATQLVLPEDLQWMALQKAELPPELSSFDLLQERELDNETMASNAFPERTAESLRGMGRITGFVRQFAVPQGAATIAEEPAEILEAATVVHLFDSTDAVQRWIDYVFVRDFRDRVGQEGPSGQQVIGVELLDVSGFHDHSAALLAVHGIPGGVLASTIVDFRVGCLLGVAYVVTKQDRALVQLAKDLGMRLERQMVRIALGG